MIHSIFLINSTLDIFFEKHWKAVVPKAVCDYFFEAHQKVTSSNDLPPVIESPEYFIFNIYKNQVYFIAICDNEVPPLFILEFLHMLENIINDYFGNSNEKTIKDNIICIYEILDEMLDNGFPLTTEPNILKQLIKPPTLLRSLTSAVTKTSKNVGNVLPSSQLTNIRWRQEGIKYATNEAYVDVIEEIHGIIDKTGNIITASVSGHINCLIKLSGMPDLCLSFENPRILEDVSLHHCVRYVRWEREKIISFIPPDGNFCLFNYQIYNLSTMHLPVHVKHNINLNQYNSRIDLSMSPKFTGGKQVEKAILRVNLPPEVINVNLTPSQGKYTFDTTTKTLEWDIGRIETLKIPTLKGPISMANEKDDKISFTPIITVGFSISQFTASGLKIKRLDMFGERYRPYKGVKYVTKAGQYEVRC